MSELHAAPLEDEPRTPMWLPVLGAALFVGAGIWWAVTPAAAPFVVVVEEPVASASAPVALAAPLAQRGPAVAGALPPSAAGLNAMPAPAGLPPLGAPSGGPAADERLRRLREQMRLKGAAGQP